MERKYQVFISSTYTDLIDERQEVTRQILNHSHFPIGMEMFAPSDEAQWHIIEKTIDSSDVYILILAYRYGSTLDIPGTGGKPRSISYTEREFEYAVKKKPVIVFVKDDIEIVHTIKQLEKLTVERRCTIEVWKETIKKILGKNYTTGQVERLKDLRSGDDVLDYIYAFIYD
ncbi:MAG: DUF4062 domain-containing protein, partial [Sphingobacteriaceae bacterium]